MSESLLRVFEEYAGRPPRGSEMDDPLLMAELRRFGAADSYFSPDRLAAGSTALAFPRIKDSNARVFFGGDQRWFGENAGSGRRSVAEYAGCGAVAAADMLAAFAYRDERLAGGLGLKFYYDGSIAKSDFLRLMQTAYRTIGSLELPVLARRYARGRYQVAGGHTAGAGRPGRIPPSLGMWGPRFQRGMVRLAASCRLRLQCHALPTLYCEYERGLQFLRQGLAAGSGVDIYTTFNAHELTLYSQGYGGRTQRCSNERHHLVAVALRANPAAGDVDVLVSSWGQAGFISYRALHDSWQGRRAFASGMYYFTETRDRKRVRASVRRSRREWLVSVWRLARWWLRRLRPTKKKQPGAE